MDFERKKEALKKSFQYCKEANDRSSESMFDKQHKLIHKIQDLAEARAGDFKTRKMAETDHTRFKEMNLVEFLEQLWHDKKESDFKSLVTEFKLSDAKQATIKARALIKRKGWEELRTLIEAVNRRGVELVPFDYLFQLLDDSGYHNVALDIAEKAPFDKAFNYYKESGHVIKAADLCKVNKNKDKIVELFEKVKKGTNEQDKKYIEDIWKSL